MLQNNSVRKLKICYKLSGFNPGSLYLLFLLLFIGTVIPVNGQQADNTEPAKVMLLGTVHLDNPGRDVNNPEVPDVLKPEKQKELDSLRNALAEFEPTKIALEVRKRHQQSFDSLYHAFRSGNLDSTFQVGDFVSRRSEQFQLGFHLAKAMGHEHVWAVDNFIPLDFDSVITYAKQHGPSLLTYLKGFRNGALMTSLDSLLEHESLTTLYRYINRTENI